MNSFAEVVDYFVAPENGIDEPGYNYCAILKGIKKNTDARALAELCVSSFKSESECGQRTCSKLRNLLMNKNQNINLFAVELQKNGLDNISKAINQFGLEMINKITPSQKTKFANSIEQTRTDESRCTLQSERGMEYHLYDINEWLISYIGDLQKVADHQWLYNHISVDLKTLCHKIGETQNLIIIDQQREKNKFSSFAIFFPIEKASTNENIGPYIEKVNRNSQDKLSDWFKFLNNFFS